MRTTHRVGCFCPAKMAKHDHFFIDGKEVTEEEYEAAIPKKGKALLDSGGVQNALMKTSKAWPRKSDSMGVNPSQKKAAEEASIKMGVPTEFAVDGQAIIRDGQHQKALQKALGVVNLDSYYDQI